MTCVLDFKSHCYLLYCEGEVNEYLKVFDMHSEIVDWGRFLEYLRLLCKDLFSAQTWNYLACNSSQHGLV